MPKINKSKVAQVSVDEKVVADADAMQPAPPEPTSPSKPSPRLPAAASPGRKELKDRASAVKEAKREYLVLARAATKLEKEHARRKEVLEQHKKSMQRALGRAPRASSGSSGIFRLLRGARTSSWRQSISTLRAARDSVRRAGRRGCDEERRARPRSIAIREGGGRMLEKSSGSMLVHVRLPHVFD